VTALNAWWHFACTDSFAADGAALPMKTDPKSTYQVSVEKRKAAKAAPPETSAIPCDQRGMCVTQLQSLLAK
jgi:hypothetical protein